MAAGQGAQRFTISETNPNDSIGGSGCACSDLMVEDRGGPYAVFSDTTTDCNQSPFVVVCAPCVRGVFCGMEDDEREKVALGEPVPMTGDEQLMEQWSDELSDRLAAAESPVSDDFILGDDDELAI